MDPAAWRGDELRSDPSWIVELTEPQRAELRAAATSGELPGLAPILRDWRRRLQSGLGVLLVRGVPVEELTEQQARPA